MPGSGSCGWKWIMCLEVDHVPGNVQEPIFSKTSEALAAEESKHTGEFAER